jgi:hypothetical protein
MPQLRRRGVDDIAVVDRRREPRIILSLPARYALGNQRDTSGQSLEFECRVINISLHAMALFAPVTGSIGDRVTVLCDEFGRLEGSITRLLAGGFVIELIMTDAERRELATKIEVYENIKNHDFSNRRRHKRIIPKDRRSVIIFGDNRRVECLVIDISKSGVAVQADLKPDIGTPLAVGSLIGRVVRHFDNGFAVKFIQEQEIDGHG